MRRPSASIWLVDRTRFAALSQTGARIALALIALLLAATFLALDAPAPPAVSHQASARGDDQADVVLYESIVDGIRGGCDYYTVAADQLRAGHYPMRPFVTFRLPTLAMVQALLPAWATLAVLWLLTAGVVVAWYMRLKPAFVRVPPRIVAMVLLAGGLVVFVQPSLVAFHEIWAGLLIALSLAIRKPGRWVEAVALALAAMLIRETAALYVGAMLLLALAEGERREAAGWAGACGIMALAVAAHAHAVAHVVEPLDLHSPGWAGLLGFGYFVHTMAISTALAQLPMWLAAPLIGLALVGWAARRDPLALRALAMFALYAALLGVAGRVDTIYWGLLVAPTLLVGLAFVPDALRDLFGAAGERRRITVTRVVR
ncbi:MAG TPA: hypothetical protein VFQ57_09640 [Sphingomonas sp.]|jgi:hypothetical protein|nr:hypothetical protein [Sphingomonas sp.]